VVEPEEEEALLRPVCPRELRVFFSRPEHDAAAVAADPTRCRAPERKKPWLPGAINA